MWNKVLIGSLPLDTPKMFHRYWWWNTGLEKPSSSDYLVYFLLFQLMGIPNLPLCATSLAFACLWHCLEPALQILLLFIFKDSTMMQFMSSKTNVTVNYWSTILYISRLIVLLLTTDKFFPVVLLWCFFIFLYVCTLQHFYSSTSPKSSNSKEL